jgi:hypothetical protein
MRSYTKTLASDLYRDTSTLHNILQDLITDEIGGDDEGEQFKLRSAPGKWQDGE